MSVIAHRKNTTIASPVSTIVSVLRKAIGSGIKLLKRVAATIVEARAHQVAIELELYRNRYKHSSKNDDDLPIVR